MHPITDVFFLRESNVNIRQYLLNDYKHAHEPVNLK
jgi:hypothetical protein